MFWGETRYLGSNQIEASGRGRSAGVRRRKITCSIAWLLSAFTVSWDGFRGRALLTLPGWWKSIDNDQVCTQLSFFVTFSLECTALAFHMAPFGVCCGDVPPDGCLAYVHVRGGTLPFCTDSRYSTTLSLSPNRDRRYLHPLCTHHSHGTYTLYSPNHIVQPGVALGEEYHGLVGTQTEGVLAPRFGSCYQKRNIGNCNTHCPRLANSPCHLQATLHNWREKNTAGKAEHAGEGSMI